MTEALEGGGGRCGVVRDFRVTWLQGQAESQVSDVKVLLPSLCSTHPPAPQHEFSIRNLSRQQPSKGESSPEPSEHLTMTLSLLVLAVYGLATLGALTCFHSTDLEEQPQGFEVTRWDQRSEGDSQPGQPSGSGSSALWNSAHSSCPVHRDLSPRQGPH